MGSLQLLAPLESDHISAENLDRILYSIFQANRTNRNISYLRFVDLAEGSIFTFNEEGARTITGRAEPDIWADLMDRGTAIRFNDGNYEVYRTVSHDPKIAVNLGIDSEVAHEIESQRRLSVIVASIILATGIGILIMVWQTRQIEAARGELELVLASTTEPILMIDNNGRLVFANEPAHALLGQSKNKNFRNAPLVSLVQNPDTRNFLEQVLDNNATDVNEFETVVPGYPAKVMFRAGVMDVRTEVGRTLGKLLVMRDVTLEKRLEDKKVSQTIHELKGMLGEVKGFIRQALDSTNEESERERREFLKVSMEKLERCYNTVATMVRSIVSAFKPQSLDLRLSHYDLAEIIQFNVNDFRSSLEQEKEGGIMLMTRLPTKLPTVCCDLNAISRVLANLLLNAVQHCPQGEITVSAEEQGEVVRVSVSDSGCGIESKHVEIIFEPHVSFRKGGTGLGLSVCRDFIKAHEGEMWVDSAGRGKGSTFYFTLPKSRPVVLSSDPAFTGRLESNCKKTGYTPEILGDLLSATRKIIEINPNAILLDLDMEDTISGISLAYRLKRSGETAKIPIVAFSSNIQEAQSELSKYEGISLDTFLKRNFTEEELSSAMSTVEAYWYLTQSS